MKSIFLCILIICCIPTLHCQTDSPYLLHRHPVGAAPLAFDKPVIDLENRSKAIEIPTKMPNHIDPRDFDINVVAYKEQEHDKLLDNLATRVGTLDSTSSYMKGAIAAIIISVGLIGGFLLGFLKLFWKSILTGVLNELNPQILRPQPLPSPAPSGGVIPSLKQ
jgi:hypothetical protein